MAGTMEHAMTDVIAVIAAGEMGAGIGKRRRAAQGHDERADVVVVVVLGVVAALEGHAERAIFR